MHPDLVPFLCCPKCRADLTPAAACPTCGPAAFPPAHAGPASPVPAAIDRWLRSLPFNASIAVVGPLPNPSLHAVAVIPADSLPLKNAAFDAVLLADSLGRATAPDALIREVGRALKPEGRWAFWNANTRATDERKILDAARVAGLTVDVGYAGFPLRLDPLLSRTAFLSIRGRVILGAGRKTVAPAFRARPSWKTLGWAAAAMLGITLLSGAWLPDPTVANRSPSYYQFGDETIHLLANAPAVYGCLMVTHRGEPLENFRESDDIGYILALQLFSASGKVLTPFAIAEIHNAVYVSSTVLLGLAVLWVLNSAVAGLLAFGLTLAVGMRMSAVIYAVVDNHSAMALFPLPFIAALLLTLDAVRRDSRKAAVAWIVLLGALVAGIDLTRHSSGIATGGTSAIALALLGIPWRRKAAWLALLAGSYLAALHGSVGVIRIHRAVALGQFKRIRLGYFRRPPNHTSTYSLLAGVARYPNSAGLETTDAALDQYIIREAGLVPPITEMDLLEAAPRLYWKFVLSHPGEYAWNVARGFSELPLFVAYVTFLKERKFDYGLPAIEPGVVVDPRDKVPGLPLLMNFRLSYLNLTLLQTAAFLASMAALLAAAIAEFRRWRRRRNSGGLLAAAWIYLFVAALPRALLPGHGQDFLFAYWVAVALSVSVLLAYRPRVA